MSALVIVLMILAGLIMLVIEVFFLPGITIAGIGGFLLIAGAVFLTYKGHGALAGHMALGGTLFAGLVLFYFSFRAKTWDRMALQSSIDSNIETVVENSIHPGDDGIAVSRLNPIGKVRVKEQIVEAKCPGHFVDENSDVEVVKVFKTYIVVKPKN
jgi:membrane-bound ClpP family serine protease